MKSITLPSIVGVGDTEMGLLSLGVSGRGKRQTLPHVVSWNGTPYLVGEGVERFTRPVEERLDFLRLGDGPDTRAMTYSTLGLLLGAGKHRASVIIGLPIEVMEDGKLAKRTLRMLRSWLKGDHKYTVNGQEINLKIGDVQIMSQPGGTFFAWGLDNAGSWKRTAVALKTLIGVCDIGFNTLDLFGVQGGQVYPEYTAGETVGVRRAAEILIQFVDQYGVRLSHHEADQFLRSAQPVLNCSAGEIDLRSVVTQAIDLAAGQVIAFVSRNWEQSDRFRYQLFTGGGTILFKKHLEDAFPKGIMLPDPVIANAVGLARYGCRIFKNADIVVGLDPGFGGFKAVKIESKST